MADLTPLQIQMCRADIGDADDPPDVTNTMLQALFDDPTLADGDLNLLRVFALRQRLGLAMNDVDDSGNVTGINSRSSQKRDHIQVALTYWESVCGISAGQGVGSTTTTPRRDSRREGRVFAWQADAGFYTRRSWDDYDV